MGGEVIALVAVMLIFGIPFFAIGTEHRRRMMELQLKLRNQGDESVKASIEALRDEVRSLRDTTTQYDVSFDSVLQRMEQRVERLERRVSEPEANAIADLRAGR